MSSSPSETSARGSGFYLLISFGMAWILWEIPIRLGIGPDNPLFQIAALPGAFSPAVAALVVRAWITREGFGDAGLALNLRRCPGTWRDGSSPWLPWR